VSNQFDLLNINKERRYDMLDPKKQKKISTMVKKHRWSKINKVLQKASSEEKEEFAKELGNDLHNNNINYLLKLLEDPDDNVKLQAVKSLGNHASDTAKTFLQDFLEKLPKDKVELEKATREAIGKINQALAYKEE